MLTKISLNGRSYYVREGHTKEQIAESLVKQINEDKDGLFSAEMVGKDSFRTFCSLLVLNIELKYD